MRSKTRHFGRGISQRQVVRPCAQPNAMADAVAALAGQQPDSPAAIRVSAYLAYQALMGLVIFEYTLELSDIKS